MSHSGKIRASASMSVEERAERRRRMLEMKAAGKTNAEIGRQFGISREAVRQILDKPAAKWGPPYRGRRGTLEKRLAKWRGRPLTAAAKRHIAELESELASL